MAKLIFILFLMFLVVLGDIAWDFLSEAVWHIGLRSQKLNFIKKRRPNRIHWKFR